MTDDELCMSAAPEFLIVTAAESAEWSHMVSDQAGAAAHRMPARTTAAIRAFIV
ncbi:MAG TPA: hypothetical protein VHX49_10625 [Candidatus Acidoferrales bacterium]|nr:hypothetical protein [Candidatus Acidoferrales bacterium]